MIKCNFQKKKMQKWIWFALVLLLSQFFLRSESGHEFKWFSTKKTGLWIQKKTDFNIIFMIWKERDLKYFPSFWGLCFGTWVVFFDWWYDGFNCSIKFLSASNDQNFVKSEEIHCAEIIRRRKNRRNYFTKSIGKKYY